MSTRPYIKRDFGRIITETPYDRLWVDAIKYVIPLHYRKYESANVWSFGPAYYACVQHICNHFFGSKVVDSTGGVPEPQISGWKERWDVWKANHQPGSERRQEDEDRKARNKRNSDRDFEEEEETTYTRTGPDPEFEAFSDWFRRQNQQAPPPKQRNVSNVYATLFVTSDAPSEVITASWRALNAKWRKDDPDGKANHEVLARINGAYAELKKIGRVK